MSGRRLLLITLFLVPWISQAPASAMSCYSCTQVNHHDGCNVNTQVCPDPEDVCYTKVEKLDSIGKVYTKGCMTSKICSGLEQLNRDYFCDRFPSTCFYCCEDSLCNEYNTGNRSSLSLQLLVCVMIVRAIFLYVA